MAPSVLYHQSSLGVGSVYCLFIGHSAYMEGNVARTTLLYPPSITSAYYPSTQRHRLRRPVG